MTVTIRRQYQVMVTNKLTGEIMAVYVMSESPDDALIDGLSAAFAHGWRSSETSPARVTLAGDGPTGVSQ